MGWVRVEADGTVVDIQAEIDAERAALKAALKAKGITYRAFAEQVGCSASNISAHLSEWTNYPLSSRIRRAARAMGLVD